MAVASGLGAGGLLSLPTYLLLLPLADYLGKGLLELLKEPILTLLAGVTRGMIALQGFQYSLWYDILQWASVLPFLLGLGVLLALPLRRRLEHLRERWPGGSASSTGFFLGVVAAFSGGCLLLGALDLLPLLTFLPSGSHGVAALVPLGWGALLLGSGSGSGSSPGSPKRLEAGGTQESSGALQVGPSAPPALGASVPRRLRMHPLEGAMVATTLRASVWLTLGGSFVSAWGILVRWCWNAFGPLPHMAGAYLYLEERTGILLQEWIYQLIRSEVSSLLGQIFLIATLTPLLFPLGRWFRRRFPGLPRWLGMLLLLAPCAFLARGIPGSLTWMGDLFRERLTGYGSLAGLEASVYLALFGAAVLPHLGMAWLALGPAAPRQPALPEGASSEEPAAIPDHIPRSENWEK